MNKKTNLTFNKKTQKWTVSSPTNSKKVFAYLGIEVLE
jgi:hypothetical protein